MSLHTVAALMAGSQRLQGGPSTCAPFFMPSYKTASMQPVLNHANTKANININTNVNTSKPPPVLPGLTSPGPAEATAKLEAKVHAPTTLPPTTHHCSHLYLCPRNPRSAHTSRHPQ